MSFVFRRVAAVLACALSLVASAVSAQTATAWPERPVRLVVGYPPGGPNDLIARVMAPKLSELLGQTVVVENKGGSNGEIATAMVAKVAPDGYTVLFASNGALTVSPSLGRQLPYDARKDLVAVGQVAINPMLLVVRKDLAAQNVRDLIDLARARPGKLNGASAGSGSVPHLGLELFKAMARLDILHVPYKGGGPAMADMMAGQTDIYFGGLATALPQVRSGNLRGLAVTSLARTAIAPEIPTIHESGLPGDDTSIWYGVLLPLGTPAQIVEKLNAAVVTTTRDPGVRRQLALNGADPLESTPAAFAAFIAIDLDKWTRLVREAGIKAE